MIFRKDWRRIVVDGTGFYWRVKNVTDAESTDTFRRELLIRLAQHPASVCRVKFDQLGYHWLTGSFHPAIITPRFVAACIRSALRDGWNPVETKQSFIWENGSELWATFSHESSL